MCRRGSNPTNQPSALKENRLALWYRQVRPQRLPNYSWLLLANSATVDTEHLSWSVSRGRSRLSRRRAIALIVQTKKKSCPNNHGWKASSAPDPLGNFLITCGYWQVRGSSARLRLHLVKLELGLHVSFPPSSQSHFSFPGVIVQGSMTWDAASARCLSRFRPRFISQKHRIQSQARSEGPALKNGFILSSIIVIGAAGGASATPTCTKAYNTQAL